MEALVSVTQTLVPLVLGLLGLGGAAGVALRFVHEGERGLKLFFGKVRRDRTGQPIMVMPGWCWLWPGVEKLLKVHVRHDTINLVDQVVTLSDGMVFRMSAVLTFHVEANPQAVYRILIETQDPRRSFADYALGVLRAEIGSKGWKEVVGGAERINTALTEAVRRRSEEWGAVVTEFRLTDCQPLSGTADTILAGSAAAERAKAVSEAAKELGLSPADMPPQLAAVMVGVPLVASIGPRAEPNAPQLGE